MEPTAQTLNSGNSRASHVAYLCILVALTAIGYLGSIFAAPSWLMTLDLALLQAVLLLWVSSQSSRGHRWSSIAYALRIEGQAALQVYCVFYLSALIMFATGYALDMLSSTPSLPGILALINPSKLNSIALWACPVTAISLAAWRLHSLQNRGHDLSTFAAGNHEQVQLTIRAPVEIVVQRLAYHLAKITSKSTPALPLIQYSNWPTVTRRVIHGTETFECVWTFGASKICIAVDGQDESTASVEMRCVLRTFYRPFQLFSTPHAAIVLMEYMQTNVLQVLRRDLALADALTHQEKLRNQALEMQLRILQAQIEPHFLFNTLANLRHLYRGDVEAGENMLNNLINYLRGVMDDLRSDVSTVAKEFDLVMNYLTIMKTRMGERLSYTFINHADVGSQVFPPAMLISIVENAIKHGLRDKSDGHIQIIAVREAETVRVTVVDNGAGFSSVDGTGVGLSNIRKRLEAIYGNRAWLEVGALQSGGFMASIVVPLGVQPPSTATLTATG